MNNFVFKQSETIGCVFLIAFSAIFMSKTLFLIVCFEENTFKASAEFSKVTNPNPLGLLILLSLTIT